MASELLITPQGEVQMTMRLVGVILLATVAGCAPMPPVALQATPADLELLAGDWEGEYESAALGRRGKVEFRLKAGTDEAFGDVLMVPRGEQTPYQSRPYPTPQGAQSMPSAELLTIRFIRASNGGVTGRLDRYWDPDRGCFAHSAFTGTVGRGVVEGMFKTTFECGAGEASGTWTVRRKPARPGTARR